MGEPRTEEEVVDVDLEEWVGGWVGGWVGTVAHLNCLFFLYLLVGWLGGWAG